MTRALDLLLFASRNLRRTKIRSALMMLAVGVGVAVIVLLFSFGLGLRDSTLEHFNKDGYFTTLRVNSVPFGKTLEKADAAAAEGERSDTQAGHETRPPGSIPILDEEAVGRIRRLKGVRSVEPVVTAFPFVRLKGRTARKVLFAVDDVASYFPQPLLTAGSRLPQAGADEALVSERLAREVGFGDPQGAVGKTLTIVAAKRATSPGDGGDEGEPQGAVTGFFGIPLEEPDGGNLGRGGGAAATEERELIIAGVFSPRADGWQVPAILRTDISGADIVTPTDWARAYQQSQVSPDTLIEVEEYASRAEGAGGEGTVERRERALGLLERLGRGYTGAIVRVEDPTHLKGVVSTMEQAGYFVSSGGKGLDEFRAYFSIINAGLGILGTISLLIASIGIANTMVMAVRERTREIGTLKALGATGYQIRMIFFIEATFIAFSGGVLGLVVASILARVSTPLVYRLVLQPGGIMAFKYFVLTPAVLLGGLLCAILVALVATIYPAHQAARVDPVRALKHVG